jgi:arginyl-tRNA synthetase
LRKAGDFSWNNTGSILEQEKDLIKLLVEFPNVVGDAAEELSPATIANYSFELVKTYNQFYQNVTILGEEDQNLMHLRLTLSKNVAKVIKNSMSLLGIHVPNQM